MRPWLIVLLVVLAVIIIGLVVLYFVGRKMEKKQEENEAKLQVGKQTVSMLVIDKKMMRIKDSGVPQIVIDQTPKYLRRSKVPIVKAKVGPKIMTLICDEKIFDLVPVKKEVKAVINGMYMMDVKGLRGAVAEKPAKPTFRQKLAKKMRELKG